MSVRPIKFNTDGSVDVVYDEGGHSGTIPAAEIKWATGIGGTEDHNFIVLACPDGCGATSTHPVGGGAAPTEVQTMFVNKTAGVGCACGAVQAGNDNVADAHVHLNVARMDGADRYML